MCHLMISLANDSSNYPSFGCIVLTNRTMRKQASDLISLFLSFSMITSSAAMAEAAKLAVSLFRNAFFNCSRS